jgi:hypothetical protein
MLLHWVDVPDLIISYLTETFMSQLDHFRLTDYILSVFIFIIPVFCFHLIKKYKNEKNVF